MKKDTIIQFVCFVTELETDEFMPKWERYAGGLMNKPAEPVLHQLVTAAKKKFRYISQHEGPEGDFLFNFMKERHSEHFPEHNVRVVHAGGYIPLPVKKRFNEEDGDLKLIVFINHNETDIDFYRQLPSYQRLNIYQAYYENCMYGYIMEFFVAETNVEELEQLIKQRPGTETGIYKESLVHNL